MNRKIFVLLMAWGLGMTMPAMAQKMYRCGNVYQDRPCSGEQEGKEIRPMAAPDPSTSAQGSVSAQCARQGAAAQKIMWARETGQLQEQQETAARSMDERNLVADVYRRHGSSAQVRAAIEADCMVQQERTVRAAELLKAAALLNGGGLPQAVGGPNEQSPANINQPARSENTSAAQATQQACQNLSQQLDSARSRQRAGGSGRTMDELNQRVRSISSQMSERGC